MANLRDHQVAADLLNGWGARLRDRGLARKGQTPGPTPRLGTPVEARTLELLDQILWEQRAATKMMWATLTPEQRQAYQDMH